jgi:hypothetical protein
VCDAPIRGAADAVLLTDEVLVEDGAPLCTPRILDENFGLTVLQADVVVVYDTAVLVIAAVIASVGIPLPILGVVKVVVVDLRQSG